jgi:hypothetical protein
MFANGDDAALGAVIAKVTDQAAGIDFGDDGDAAFRKEVFGFIVGAPIADDGRDFADHEPFDIWAAGFTVGLICAVVADLRIGENDDLAAIGRVGEDFLIAGDGGIENNFAGALSGRSKTDAFEDDAVFQDENCLLQPIDS